MSISPRKERSSPTLIIRNRTRPRPEQVYSNFTFDEGSLTAGTQKRLRNRFLSSRLEVKICLGISAALVFGLLLVYLQYRCVITSSSSSRLERASILLSPSGALLNNSKSPNPSRSFAESSYKNELSPSNLALLNRGPAYNPFRTATVPLVYRTVLERLDRLWELENAQQEALTDPSSSPLTSATVPLLKSETEAFSSSKQTPTILDDICDSDSDHSDLAPDDDDGQRRRPRRCRFLFPLRIAEQESKARIHLLEIIQTAQRLDRILVLPHVGKSRLGVCYKWGFGVYYDEDEVVGMLEEQGVRVVTQEVFRGWLELRKGGEGEGRVLRGQVVSLGVGATAGARMDSDRDRARVEIPSLVSASALGDGDQWNGLVVSVDDQPVGDIRNDSRFPRCFADRFGGLMRLDEFVPLEIYPSPALGKVLRTQPIGEEVVAALGREDVWRASRVPRSSLEDREMEGDFVIEDLDPEILLLNWNMRYPIFMQPFRGTISYAPFLERLVKTELMPRLPYLFIHWRMEGVSKGVLGDCASDLVDTVARVLLSHGTGVSGVGDGIEKVWFAGDFPVPVSDYDKGGDGASVSPGFIEKSGTFRDFGDEHREAVGILVDAFREGGELDKWGITDLAGEVEAFRRRRRMEVDLELLSDPGVMGILDKMIGVEAAIFVGGSKRCARTSSFTKQVIDGRREKLKDANHVQNVVEYFG
ncbi:hypothetical protein GYMLUDRAFT_87639 [Collybiopsis luxurians FD-317 M1]|uniref:Proteophosphoglycan 5 n=1 Tax=Collybiopsis luxurians FD-317 M1 TaxID=944289 RepID=A0A0D0CK87_9AGAR|nr:hypothetical protein GYMLUDRAFT_87639 [Collybiopsis luxurians FD-317 M1]